MGKVYTDDFLISELHRFYKKEGFVPQNSMMSPKYGYPSSVSYVSHFGSWNNALETAGLLVNKHTLDGTETCSYCGCTIEETSQWYYDENNVRYCTKHGQRNKPDYVKGSLDINSRVGLGRTGEILVTKVLNINKEYDCNRISCGYKFDLYNEKYGKIDVKTSLFSNDKYNRWGFVFNAKKEANTYICIGLSSDRKIVEHIWIVPNENNIKNKVVFTIKNTYRSLSNRKHWEVDVKPYNDMWQTMKLDNCKIMVDKSKDGYADHAKLNNVVENTIKQVEQITDTSQYRLSDF